MERRFKKIGVYWIDIIAYGGNGLYEPAKAYTEGGLVRKNKNYCLIQNPETILTKADGQLVNHPFRKPKFYYIPNGLIKEIVNYDEKK